MGIPPLAHINDSSTRSWVRKRIASHLCLGVCLSAAVAGFATEPEDRYSQEQIILVADSRQSGQDIARENGLEVSHTFRHLAEHYGNWWGVCTKTPENRQSIDTLIKNINSSGRSGVLAERDYIFTLQYEENDEGETPNDPKFKELWGMGSSKQGGIDAELAWGLTKGSESVILASVDTGVNYNHEDLKANMWTNPDEIPGNGKDDDGNGYVDDIHGIDSTTNTGNPMDQHMHGSHTSGTMSGVGNNNIGVAGVCWNVKILAIRFIRRDCREGLSTNAMKAFDYLIGLKKKGHNIVVTNNSYGGGGFQKSTQDSIQALEDNGIMFVAAAGNNKSNNDSKAFYPANYKVPSLISVMSTERGDKVSSFTNYGKTTVHLAAPGTKVLSCNKSNNGYSSISGTSMSSPHVAGAVALIKSAYPDASPALVKEAILVNVDQTSTLADRCITGGRLNIYTVLRRGLRPLCQP